MQNSVCYFEKNKEKKLSLVLTVQEDSRAVDSVLLSTWRDGVPRCTE